MMNKLIIKEKSIFRSSRPEVFCKKGALTNFSKFTGKHLCQGLIFNPIQDGGGGGAKRSPPTSFSPVTSTKVGISHQNFLTLGFNPFTTMA